MHTTVTAKQEIIGQQEIFLEVIEDVWKIDDCAEAEADFVAALTITYHRFRKLRKTKTSSAPSIEFVRQSFFPIGDNTVLGISPECDLEIDAHGYAVPRFFRKLNPEELKLETIDFFFRGNSSLSDSGKNLSRVFSDRDLLKSLPIRVKFAVAGSVAAALLCRSKFWRLPNREKVSVAKALSNFEANSRYFKKFFSRTGQKYTKLYVTNFYSAGNLGLIKAAKRAGLQVIDVQHGVQNNVAAYEYFDQIPAGIRPHELMRWFVTDYEKKADLKSSWGGGLKQKFSEGQGLRILVTLQPSNSDNFFSALSSSALSNHHLIVRPHPRLNNQEFVDSLQSKIQQNFELDMLSGISERFETVDFHLTEYSSCVLDGIKAGVPSVCVHPIARKYFADIEEGNLLQIFNCMEEFLEYVKDA